MTATTTANPSGSIEQMVTLFPEHKLLILFAVFGFAYYYLVYRPSCKDRRAEREVEREHEVKERALQREHEIRKLEAEKKIAADQVMLVMTAQTITQMLTNVIGDVKELVADLPRRA